MASHSNPVQQGPATNQNPQNPASDAGFSNEVNTNTVPQHPVANRRTHPAFKNATILKASVTKARPVTRSTTKQNAGLLETVIRSNAGFLSASPIVNTQQNTTVTPTMPPMSATTTPHNSYVNFDPSTQLLQEQQRATTPYTPMHPTTLTNSLQHANSTDNDPSSQLLQDIQQMPGLQQAPTVEPHQDQEAGDEHMYAIDSDNDSDNDDDEDFPEDIRNPTDMPSLFHSLQILFDRNLDMKLDPIANGLKKINKKLTLQNKQLKNELADMKKNSAQRDALVDHLQKQMEYLVAVAPPPTDNPTPPLPPPKPAALRDWANTLANAPEPPPINFPREKRKIVIPSGDPNVERLTDSQLTQIRVTANAALVEARAPPNAVIVTASQNDKGNVVLTTRSDCEASTILQFNTQIRQALRNTAVNTTPLHAHEAWHKIMVHGVDLQAYPEDTTGTGMGLLTEELQRSNAGLTMVAPPRSLTRPESRLNKTTSTVVLAFRSEAEAKMFTTKGVWIDGRHKKTDRFYQCRPTDQCSQCQGFGHHWKRCKADPKCRICAEAHPTTSHTCPKCPTRARECTHITAKCTNCQGSHTSTDPACPTRTQLLESYHPRRQTAPDLTMQ
jgi:hypothetical protein